MEKTTPTEAHEALRHSEERFRLLVESVRDYAIFMLDPRGVVATWNVGAERMKGYAAHEIIGQHFSRFYEEADIVAGKCELELAGAARDGRYEDEGWRLRKDGTRFWANVILTAIRDPKGELVGFAKVTRDLSERRQAEETRLRLAHESAAREAAQRSAGLLARLQKLTGALAGARLPEEVARLLVEEGSALLGATTSAFFRPYGEDRLRLVRSHGASPELIEAFTDLPVAARVPPTVAYRTREPQIAETPEDYVRHFPERPESAPLQGSVAAFPLIAGDIVLGILGFRFAERRRFEPDERAVMQAWASQAAQALDRADVYASELEGRRKIEALGGLAAALSRALDVRDVANAIVTSTMQAMRADICTVHELDTRTGILHLVEASGCAPEIVEQIQRIGPDSDNPMYRTQTTGEIVWVESPEEYHEFSPRFSSARSRRAQAFWSAPLVAEGRSIGLLGAGFHGPRVFTASEREFVATFSRQAAEAFLRARRLESERQARELAEKLQTRASFLVDATTALARSLDYETTLRQVVELTVPQLADWCAIDIVEEGRDRPRRLAVAHVDPTKARLVEELTTTSPPHREVSGLARALRGGQAQLFEEVPDALLVEICTSEEQLRLARELALRSAMVVPLLRRGSPLGALTFGYAESGRRYTEDDLRFAEELARRCVVAIENARLYASAESARNAADVANRAKDEFLAVVSHELRTPLNAIMGWSKLMTANTFDDNRRARAIETIERNAVAMAQLIEDLLDMSRIIGGKMRLEVQAVDVLTVVEAALESIRPAAEAKEIQIAPVLEDARSLPPLLGDPTRLQQIVWNLLSNAVKFTPREGRVGVGLRRRDAFLEITVSDSGKGIAPGFLPHVFDAFRQEDASYTRSRGGLGLGLAITRQLVELHGGRITAESAGEGQGATFIASFPVGATVRPSSAIAARRNTSAPPFREDRALERAAQLEGLRVLVVDDEPDARDLVRTILQSCGCHVRVASGVDAALALFAEEPPDLLVSDIGMPGRDGYDLIQAVRALPPERGGDVPAAALTAYARAEDRRRLLHAGYAQHVPKPVEPTELVSIVAGLTRSGDRA